LVAFDPDFLVFLVAFDPDFLVFFVAFDPVFLVFLEEDFLVFLEEDLLVFLELLDDEDLLAAPLDFDFLEIVDFLLF